MLPESLESALVACHAPTQRCQQAKAISSHDIIRVYTRKYSIAEKFVIITIWHFCGHPQKINAKFPPQVHNIIIIVCSEPNHRLPIMSGIQQTTLLTILTWGTKKSRHLLPELIMYKLVNSSLKCHMEFLMGSASYEYQECLLQKKECKPCNSLTWLCSLSWYSLTPCGPDLIASWTSAVQ